MGNYPGKGGQVFTISFKDVMFPDQILKIGKDVAISEPVQEKGGYTYTLTPLNKKTKQLFKQVGISVFNLNLE